LTSRRRTWFYAIADRRSRHAEMSERLPGSPGRFTLRMALNTGLVLTVMFLR
jgi:hypothetical protein